MPNNSNPALIDTPKQWAARVTAVNTSPDASTATNLVSMITGGANGTRVDRVTVTHAPISSATANTGGQVRFYLKVSTTYRLLKEIAATAVARSATLPGFAAEWNRGDGGPVCILRSGEELYVGTEKAEPYDFYAIGGDY